MSQYPQLLHTVPNHSKPPKRFILPTCWAPRGGRWLFMSSSDWPPWSTLQTVQQLCISSLSVKLSTDASNSHHSSCCSHVQFIALPAKAGGAMLGTIGRSTSTVSVSQERERTLATRAGCVRRILTGTWTTSLHHASSRLGMPARWLCRASPPCCG